jgi:acetyltransferase-like isoleucine patch superfamily enzyme
MAACRAAVRCAIALITDQRWSNCLLMQERPELTGAPLDGVPPPAPVIEPPRRPGPRRIVRRIYNDVLGTRPRLLFIQFLVAFVPRMTFGWIRPLLYRLAGIRIGRRTNIYGRVDIEGVGPIEKNVTVGECCMFTTPLYLNASGQIRIGRNVVIGHHAMIITDDHRMDSPEQRCGERYSRPVVVEDGVWIAARVTILPGVTLGRGCVVAAGALVTRDVPPHTLVAGVPARAIKTLPSG